MVSASEFRRFQELRSGLLKAPAIRRRTESVWVKLYVLLDALGEDSGVGLGEDFFFLAEADALGDGVCDGVGLAVVFFFGDGDFSGVADGFGVADFSAADFFFRCLRGVGVGVGAKIFLSLVPNDSSAGARTEKPVSIAQTISIIRSSRIESRNLAQALIARARKAQIGAGPPSCRRENATLRLHGLRAGRLQYRLFFRQLGEHGLIQTNPAFEIFEREILVRRMGAAIGQGQSH